MLLSRLHERYDEQTIASLHRLAAQWLADHNHVDEALRHLIAIPDYEAAADLIEARRVSALNDQRFLEMDAWINLIPAHVRNRRPFLLVCQAWLFHYRLENTACLASVQHAFDLLNSLGDAFSKTSRQLLTPKFSPCARSSTDSSRCARHGTTSPQSGQHHGSVLSAFAVATVYISTWLRRSLTTFEERPDYRI